MGRDREDIDNPGGSRDPGRPDRADERSAGGAGRNQVRPAAPEPERRRLFARAPRSGIEFQATQPPKKPAAGAPQVRPPVTTPSAASGRPASREPRKPGKDRAAIQFSSVRAPRPEWTPPNIRAPKAAKEPDTSKLPQWRCRPALSRLVTAAVVLVPVLAAVGVAIGLQLLVTEPTGSFARVSWWIGIIGLSAVTYVLAERLARRAMPLAVLLKISLVFPGDPPNRLAVARRAARTREFGERVDEALTTGKGEPPSIAAERVVAMSAALSAHDRRTRGHAERVRALTDLVAAELGLSEADQNRLRWAALLHDVGKIRVHPGLLNKQGRLSQGERELLRRHPLEGAKLTAPLAGWLGEWASAVAEHHERHDGGGYPFGLEGEAISLGARIVAVVDAYDAMTSVGAGNAGALFGARRRPMSPEAARAEIARCAGTQFDPRVTRAFLAVPAKKLKRLVPVGWAAVIPIGNGAPDVAALGKTAAMILAAVAISVLGVWKPWSPETGVLSNTPSAAAANGVGQSSTADSQSTGATRTTGGTDAAGVRTAASHGTGNGHVANLQASDGGSARGAARGTHKSDSPRHGGAGATTSSSSGSSPTTQGTSPSTTSGGSPPTTSGRHHGGSPPTTNPGPPPTTRRTSPPTTKPGPPPTTPPTTAGHPAPAPVTGLTADATCASIIVGPQISLSWNQSSSSWVTGYEILSSTDGQNYSAIASVSASTTSYTDTSVQGLGVTYWYEIVAESAYGNTTSPPVSATTPLTCL